MGKSEGKTFLGTTACDITLRQTEENLRRISGQNTIRESVCIQSFGRSVVGYGNLDAQFQT